MPDEPVIYPRLVLKQVEGDEPNEEYVVMALELDGDPDNSELSIHCGYISDLDAETLQALTEQGETMASQINVVFENLIEKDDLPSDEDD